MPRFERVTFLPHARERMGQYGVTEGEVRAVLEEPSEEGAANLGGATLRRASANPAYSALHAGRDP